jgi:hypothetical protein
MALTIAFKPSTDKAPRVPGSRRRAVVGITFDSSYPTGGETVLASDIGLVSIDAAIVGLTSTGKPVYWTGSKLKVFSAIGTEVSDTTDLSAEVVTVEFIGI